MNLEFLLLILGMTLVTYIPRLLPAVLVDKLRLSPGLEKFLKLIPYTAMAALIFPGIITVDPDRIYVGIAGAVVAGFLAYKKLPVMVCVLAAIFTDFLIYLIV